MTGAGRMKNGRQNAEKEKIVSLDNFSARFSSVSEIFYTFEANMGNSTN
ncbi:MULTISPECIES: hypothetical protein [Bacteroidales]|nr:MULTISPECIES: hypothetical protein [Bacteroidales]MCR8882488.1 hypothetical protein [Phocaeicola plebeius]MDM8286098.1 hypothetical protein [Phocaeicola plebeius]